MEIKRHERQLGEAMNLFSKTNKTKTKSTTEEGKVLLIWKEIKSDLLNLIFTNAHQKTGWSCGRIEIEIKMILNAAGLFCVIDCKEF